MAPDTVLVGCKIRNGIRIFVDREFADLAGPKTMRPAAPGTLPKTEAFTEVDRALIDAWLTENRSNALVTSGSVFLASE